jgi:hypothetical protein
MRKIARFSRALTILTFAAMLAAPVAAVAQFNAFKDPVSGNNNQASGGTASGPDLKAVSDKVDAGKITVGATAYVVATFRNNGTSPVKASGINLYPSSTVTANVSLNKCVDIPLPPDAQCAVTVAVTGLQVGAWRVEILLDHDGRTRLATAALTGQVESSTEKEDSKVKTDVDATPETLDFGNNAGGIPLVKSVLLRNRTANKVALSSIMLDTPERSGFSFKSECPESLAPGESCVINVTWSPLSKGAAQAVLRINHSARSGLTKIDIKGIFAPGLVASASLYPEATPDKGLLVSDRNLIDFGGGVSSGADVTLSLVNLGVVDLTLSAMRLAGTDNGLSISAAGCRPGLTLRPGDACPLTVTWVPPRAGSVIDDLQIQHSGARGVLVLPVRGTATTAAVREANVLRQNNPVIENMKEVRIDTRSEKSGEKTASTPQIDQTSIASRPFNGYSVTSHSPTKAVINGSAGSRVVRDGEDVVISGIKWTATIVTNGVVMSNDTDEFLLVFDNSLQPYTRAQTGAIPAPATVSPSLTPAPATTAGSPTAVPPTAAVSP